MGEKVTSRYTCELEWMKFPTDPEGRAPGPVKEYKLSPEELAELTAKLPKPTGKAPIKLPPGRGRNRKEDEEMLTGDNLTEICQNNMPTDNFKPEVRDEMTEDIDSIGQTGSESQENKGFEVYDKKENPDTAGQDGQVAAGDGDKPKTRPEILREKLTREQYLTMKGEGLSDRDVLKKINIPTTWIDVLVKMKKGWEIVQSAPPQKSKMEKIEEPRAQAVSGITIAQAMELREELAEDIESLDRILDAGSPGEDVTERVYRALVQMRDEYQARKNRIDELFNSTVLSL